MVVYSNTLGRISKWFVDENELQKIKQYNVVAELSALELIDKKIGRQICDQIDASLLEGPKKKLEDWHDMMQKVSFRDKKQVATSHQMVQCFFGSDLVQNKFFKGLRSETIMMLLQSCRLLNVKAGEFIYHSHQPASHGTLG